MCTIVPNLWVLFFVFKTGFACTVLELTLWTRVILNSEIQFISLCLPAEIKSICHCTWLQSLFLIIKNCIYFWVVVVHAFNPRIWEAEAGRRILSSEFEAHLVSRENSRTVRASQGSPALKKQNKKSYIYLSVGLCVWMLARHGPRAEVRVDSLLLPLVLSIKCLSVGQQVPYLLDSSYTFLLT